MYHLLSKGSGESQLPFRQIHAPLPCCCVTRGVLCSLYPPQQQPGQCWLRLTHPSWVMSLQTLDINIPTRTLITSLLKERKRNASIFISILLTQCLFEKQTKSCPEHLLCFHLYLPLLHFMLYNY